MSTLYDVKKVSIILMALGVPYNIDCRHEDGFADDPSSEASSETIGSCGKKVTNVLPDDSVDITLSLLYGSASVPVLWAIYEAWKAARGNFPMSITVNDGNTGEIYQYTNVSFKKRPGNKFAHESGTEAITWEFKAEQKIYLKQP